MILVTGATGFVGSKFVSSILDRGGSVKALVRNRTETLPEAVEQVEIGDLSLFSEVINQNIFVDVQVVIHAAARVHMMNDVSKNPLDEFRKVNTQATLQLARNAAESGVKRFVFLSSIKVNGEDTSSNHPFSPDDKFVPTDPYGLSKYEAEQGLIALAEETEMEVVIIRPPLVYGPGVRANFASMLKWVYKQVPLPLGAVNNKRSLVALENLVDFMIFCTDYKKTPDAKNEVFLISDGEDVSTTQLLRKVAKAFNKKPLLLPIPIFLMTTVANLLGKEDVAKRLFSSLQVDSSKARDLLGWKPVITMDEQLNKTAKSYLENNNA